MKPSTKIKLTIASGVIGLAIIAWLVWGNSLRMTQANRAFQSGALDQARRGYQQLQRQAPKAPAPAHNLGLCDYLQGNLASSLKFLNQAAKQVETLKSKNRKKTVANPVYYQLGNGLFKTAEKATQSNAGYQAALDSYQKAIIANPADLDAKYNYELTKLRLEAAQHKQNTPEQSQANDQPKNQKNNNSQANQNNQSKPGNGASKPNQGAMTKEEAAALLKMSENAAQYHGPVVPGKTTTDKDW